MSVSAPVEVEEAPERELTRVIFGNSNPQTTVERRDAEGNVRARVQIPARHLKQTTTVGTMRPDFDDREHVELTLSTDNDRQLTMIAERLGAEHQLYAVGVYECEQGVGVHHGGAKPDWVWSSDPAFAKALAFHFGCPALSEEPKMLLTNGGRDAIHKQHLDTATQPAAFNYGAISANSGAGFAAADTTLAGEIATGGGGLIRKQMTFFHTTGTNTSTLTATWTANGSDALAVTVASWANFNASAAGTMGEEDAISPTATLSVVGDSITVTFTLTAG